MEGFEARSFPRYLTGYAAVLLSAGFLFQNHTNLSIVATSIYFILACITDTHKAKIPNLLNIALAVSGLSLNTFMRGWPGASHSLLGLALGLLLLIVPYLMGGFGAGDVKALGALGAIVGPTAILNIFIYMALFGGAMAILHYISNRNLAEKIREVWLRLRTTALSGTAPDMAPCNKETLRFPYAAAIACGYYTYLTWGVFL